MQLLSDKITGNSLTADEWNEVPREIENVITADGIVLSGGDLNQLGKGISNYVANNTFYSDSGAVDASVLTVIGSKQGPTVYLNGMSIRFIAVATNTGTTTVNVNGLGIKPLRRSDSAELSAGDISTTIITEATYISASDEFRINGGADKWKAQAIEGAWTFGAATIFQAITTFEAQATFEVQTNFEASISLADSIKVLFGASNDANIEYVNGSDSLDINVSNTADLYIRDNGTARMQYDNSANQFLFINGADVVLHDDIKLHLGASLDVDLDYDSVNNSFDINILSGMSHRFRQNGVDQLSFNSTFGPAWTYAADSTVGIANSNDANISIGFNSVTTNENRFILGSAFDTTDWMLMGNVFAGNAGARNYSLDMRRQATGVTDYIRCNVNGVTKMNVTAAGRVQGTGTFVDLSDRKSKKNIRDIKGLVDSKAIIQGLKPTRYDRSNGFGEEVDEDGFVADEMETIFPEAVVIFDDGKRMVHDLDTNGDFKFGPTDTTKEKPLFKEIDTGIILKGVQTGKIIPHLVAMLQDQIDINEDQELRIKQLESKSKPKP